MFHDHLNGAPACRFLNNVRVRSESQTEPQVTFMLNTPSLSEAPAMHARVVKVQPLHVARFAPGCGQQEVTGLVPVKLHVTTDSQFSTQTVRLEAACCFAPNTLWSNCRATKKHCWYSDKWWRYANYQRVDLKDQDPEEMKLQR